MRIPIAFILATLALLSSMAVGADQAATGAGKIEGTVRFTGDLPRARAIMVSDGTTIMHQDLEVDPQGLGLRSVAVWIDNAPAQPRVKDTRAVLVDQREWIFVPRVVAVQHGQAVRFENNDAVNHSSGHFRRFQEIGWRHLGGHLASGQGYAHSA